MGKVREPRHPLEKRDLLHADTPDEKRINAIGRKLLDEGRDAEAVDYIEITKDAGMVADLEKRALSEGSVWLLKQAVRIRGGEVSPETWLTIVDAAKGRERWADAVLALDLAGRPEESEELRLEKCPDFEPWKPQNK